MAISRMRNLMLDEFDPAAGVCALVLARFVDMPPRSRTSHDDLHEVAQAALDSGQVPLGPLEYSESEVTDSVRQLVPARIVTTADGDNITLQLGLFLGDGGCTGIGGTRYGHIPGIEARERAAIFLPDVEAGLAEMIVYAREHARVVGYAGAIDVSLELHSDAPIVPCIVDPENGRAVFGAPLASFEPITFSYGLDVPDEVVQSVYYDVACEVARRFGAEAPQFLTRRFLREEALVGA